MTIEQLIAKIDKRRAEYAEQLAELRAAGEPVQTNAGDLLLAELAGFVVNLETGAVCLASDFRPWWVEGLAVGAAEQREGVPV
jgi:hypothetical protein